MEILRKIDLGIVQIFIEVKTILIDDKDVFEIFFQQIQFVQEYWENFYIYRVFNVGDLERVRLVRINNISFRMDQKQVWLWMMIQVVNNGMQLQKMRWRWKMLEFLMQFFVYL